jgi:hypothetical protein
MDEEVGELQGRFVDRRSDRYTKLEAQYIPDEAECEEADAVEE